MATSKRVRLPSELIFAVFIAPLSNSLPPAHYAVFPSRHTSKRPLTSEDVGKNSKRPHQRTLLQPTLQRGHLPKLHQISPHLLRFPNSVRWTRDHKLLRLTTRHRLYLTRLLQRLTSQLQQTASPFQRTLVRPNKTKIQQITSYESVYRRRRHRHVPLNPYLALHLPT